MYEPIKYWTNRKRPNKYDHIRDIEREDLEPFVKYADTILDYGVGTGRMMPLYNGKRVRGIDIVDTYKKECIGNAVDNDVLLTWATSVEGKFDVGICTKVVLHEENPKEIIDTLARHCKKVFISTAIHTDSAHCFTHDYMELLDEYDILLWNQHENELHIVYAKLT